MIKAVDVAVVGAGAAGIAAAVAAGRTGARTLLLDARLCPGGTGGFSGLTTLCGLYDDAGHELNEGFPHEFAAALAECAPTRMGKFWVLPYRPERFRSLAAEFLADAGVKTAWQTPLDEVVAHGSLIRRLNGISIGAVVDCSGSAEVARKVGLTCLATDETTQAPAVVFTLHNVVCDVSTTAAAVRVMLPLARAGLPPVSFEPAVGPGSITLKFSGRPEQAPTLIAFLREHVAGFADCKPSTADFQLAHRAGRMILGEHVLTGAEVLSGAKFPDAIARCAWPMEQWDATGRLRLQPLPTGGWYEIPARCVQARGVKNLFMAGKTLSADELAIASARVMGCGLATGTAAGHFAAATLD